MLTLRYDLHNSEHITPDAERLTAPFCHTLLTEEQCSVLPIYR